MSKQSAPNEDPSAGNGDRRDFVTKAVATVAGVAVGVTPAAAGLYTFIDPIRERQRPSQAGASNDDTSGGPGRWLKIAPLSDLKPGGDPQVFPVIADSWDAWNYYPPHPIGSVFLRLVSGAAKPIAFTATCPHLGCFVDFSKAAHCFKCPCHNSEFDLDGNKIKGPPPRGMDELDVEVRQDNEVWVRFVKFHAGHVEKIPE